MSDEQNGYEDLQGKVLGAVRQERFRQEQLRKSGKFSHTCATPGANNDKCNTILGEEVGEAAKALNDGDITGLRTELVQVAAVAVAWVERLDAEARMTVVVSSARENMMTEIRGAVDNARPIGLDVEILIAIQVEGLEPVAPAPRSHRATAFADVAAERERQITKGYTEEHDDSHGNGSIAAAAISFTAAALGDQRLAENMYPFDLGFVAKATDSTRKLLVKAAALLIAEIERQDRAAEDRGANAADMADGESSSADTGDGES